jgi:hypothetical protein
MSGLIWKNMFTVYQKYQSKYTGVGLSIILLLSACGTGDVPASGNTAMATPEAISTNVVDSAKVPLGDGKLSTTTPQIGYVYACSIPNSPIPPMRSNWISADGKTWNSTAKMTVQGAVTWVSQFMIKLTGGVRRIDGNGLPNHPTGTFPITQNDPARAFDGNPNAIESAPIVWGGCRKIQSLLPNQPAQALGRSAY